MVPNWFLDHLQPFLVKPFLDQMPNKGFALLAAGQFVTRLQDFGLWGSYLDGSWEAMPSITAFFLDIQDQYKSQSLDQLKKYELTWSFTIVAKASQAIANNIANTLLLILHIV